MDTNSQNGAHCPCNINRIVHGLQTLSIILPDRSQITYSIATGTFSQTPSIGIICASFCTDVWILTTKGAEMCNRLLHSSAECDQSHFFVNACDVYVKTVTEMCRLNPPVGVKKKGVGTLESPFSSSSTQSTASKATAWRTLCTPLHCFLALDSSCAAPNKPVTYLLQPPESTPAPRDAHTSTLFTPLTQIYVP